MTRITPLVKGLITGTLMIAFSLVLIYAELPANSGLQYVGFALFGTGIAWTLIEYSKSPDYSHKFGDIFGQGFRCFIIIALMMVMFTAIYGWLHPEMIDEAAKNFRADLLKQGNRVPAEIDKEVTLMRKNFLTGNIMLTIFGTLIMGSVFTAAGAAILLMRKR